MKKLGLLILAMALALIMIIPAGVVFAAPGNPPAGSFVNAGDVPPGSKLVLNITYKVTNDEDSGNIGYWALDNYNKHLQVWQEPDGTTFYVVARYDGQWQTFAGALSPGAGVAQNSDGQGTFEGGYIATFNFTGTFNPSLLKISGNTVALDFGGTKADILLGTYGAGQTGDISSTDVLSEYFPGYTGFIQPSWGWTYHYKSQTWNNFSYGTTGDIVVK